MGSLSGERICAYCGAANPPLSDFCSACFRPLTGSLALQSSPTGGGTRVRRTDLQKAKPRRARQVTLLAALATFVVGAALLIGSDRLGPWAGPFGVILVLVALISLLLASQFSRWEPEPR